MKTTSWSFPSRGFLAASVSVILALSTGCVMSGDERTDAFSQAVTQEMGKMHSDLSALMQSSGLAKEAAGGTAVVQQFAWNQSCGCYTRSAYTTTEGGANATRGDTVVFKDAHGNSLQRSNLSALQTIDHRRKASFTRGTGNWEWDHKSIVTVSREGSTTWLIRNGSFSGKYENETFSSATVKGLKRRWENGTPRFAEAGVIEVDRPLRKWKIEYLGGGQAKAEVIVKRTRRTNTFDIQVN